jgi:AhpD family alkylhydroperoxidase
MDHVSQGGEWLGFPGTRHRSGAMNAGSAVSKSPIEYEDASPEVRAVYDDIMATRKTDWVNNYWKVLANHPTTLRRMWANSKEVMGPGALDPLTKELIYMAVSVTNGCGYCIASHGAAARKKGMTSEQHAELMAIIGLANETNAHAAALELQIDDKFR